ncbi:MAG: flavodoxin family protein [Actinomycetota bacterium]
MSALVVYESMFGNTQAIARDIADGLSSHMSVETVEVGDAPKVVDAGVELLVVGGPTHALGMSRARTRRDAAQQAGHAVVSTGIGIREWLATVQGGSKNIAAAAFDTRINKPRVPGSAARAAQKRLGRLGFRTVVPAESFWVTGTPGPLLDGEPERARRWGERLGSIFSTTERTRRVS